MRQVPQQAEHDDDAESLLARRVGVCDRLGCTLVLWALLQSPENRGCGLRLARSYILARLSLLSDQPVAISLARPSRNPRQPQTESLHDCWRIRARGESTRELDAERALLLARC